MRLPDNTTKALAGALAAVGAGLAGGCGRGDEPDLANGKTLFVQKCGACHMLNRANTRGVQGPNLDHAFAQSRRDGLGESTVAGVVRKQIGNVRATSTMPEDLVTGEDARDVAAYVAMVAAQPGQDQGQLANAGRPKVSKKPAEAKNGTLKIDADPTGALAFTAARAIAKAGPVEFVMANRASIQHDIAVKGGGTSKKGPVVGQGGTSRFRASLKPGKYTFYCSVPGHEPGGMKGELTVR